MKKISLINGPGSHGTLLLNCLNKSGAEVQSFCYYPKFSEQRFEKNQLKSEYLSNWFQVKDRALAFYANRIKNDPKLYSEGLWQMYESEVSNRLNTPDILIAWPQVSLKSIEKQKKQNGFSILEYPMIHVLSWQKQMKQVYKQLNICESTNIFSAEIEKKMILEIQNADKINVLSSYAKNTFIESGVPENKISVIPPYVNSDHFFMDNKVKKNDKFTFLFVGRIDVLKGAHILLEAFSKANIKNSQLVLVGHFNSEIKPYFERYSQNVIHLPYQNREHLNKTYNQSHVLVLPSIQESFGMVVLEAALCGLPVIVSNNTIADDAVHELNGLVFKSGNLNELIEALRCIYNNYTKFNFSDIRENMMSKFNEKKYLLSYLNLISSL